MSAPFAAARGITALMSCGCPTNHQRDALRVRAERDAAMGTAAQRGETCTVKAASASPATNRPAGADEAALSIQAAARSRLDRRKLAHSRTNERDLTVSLASTLVSELQMVGQSFAFSKLSATNMALKSLSALVRYPHLTSIDLSQNKLRSLASLCALRSLRSLCVRDNLLLTFDLPVPRELSKLAEPKGLTSLDIRGNALQHTGAIGEHLDLTELALDNNCLTSLGGLGALHQLRRLSASGNRITDISDLNRALPHLIELDLSNNRLRAVAEVASLRSLAILRLSKNRLTKLPQMMRLRCLHTVEVDHNEIERLSILKECLTDAPSLRSLMVKPNPLYVTDETRLEVLWLLPSLEQLDGVPVTSVEKVSSSNFHSADHEEILTIRRRHLPHEGLAARASGPARTPIAVLEQGSLLKYYRDQYAATSHLYHK